MAHRRPDTSVLAVITHFAHLAFDESAPSGLLMK
jgi:hypothetical protein